MKFKFEELEVWQLALTFAVFISRLVQTFPAEEKFALASQMRRAAFSVGLNIAEGSGRQTKKDFCHFIRTSISSLLEVVACGKIAAELNYLSADDQSAIDQQSEKLYFKLIALEKYLKGRSTTTTA